MTAASQDISANGPRLAKAGGGPEPYLALWWGVSKLEGELAEGSLWAASGRLLCT